MKILPLPPQTKLTDEQRQIASRWLNSNTRLQKTGCPICGGRDMRIDPFLWEFTSYSSGSPARLGLTGGFSYPFFTITCQQCGHFVGFNAVAVGLIEIPDSESERKEER